MNVKRVNRAFRMAFTFLAVLPLPIAGKELFVFRFNLKPRTARLMGSKLSQWGSRLFLLLLFFLSACDQAREAERLIASAEKSEKKGQLR